MQIEILNETYNYKNTSLLDVLPKNKWNKFFNSQLNELKGISDELKREIEEDKVNIFPSIENVFRIFRELEPHEIKCVILGMSPYETIDKYTKLNNAVGIAFSIPKGRKLNPSVRNIINEVKSCGYKINEKNGDLTKWIKEGVFLLNVSLTVIQDIANSHLKLYEDFTIALIKYLAKNKDIVFLLWGSDAQKYEKYLTNIIKCSHPSGFSHKSTNNPFTGSKCFIKVNELLKKLDIKEINWDII